jgi:hypothetical protein
MYELHPAVGDILWSIELPGVTVLLDNACSGEQTILANLNEIGRVSS